jgi:putative flippase GtrA
MVAGVSIVRSTRTWGDLVRRLLKFHMVGAVGIGVQLCFLFLFKTVLHFNYLLATGLAVECAVLHNFLWHEHYTWADRRESSTGLLRRLMRFNLSTGLISIVGNLLLMRLFVGSLHLQYMVANLLTIGACSLANFFATDRMVFQAGLSPEEG